MPPTVSVPRPERGGLDRLLRLVPVIATLLVLAVPMCADGLPGHEMTAMTESTSLTMLGSTAVSPMGHDHCAGHGCGAPRAASEVDTASGDPGPHRGVLMSCLLLLVAVLIAALRSPRLAAHERAPRTAGEGIQRPVGRALLLSRLQLCVIRT